MSNPLTTPLLPTQPSCRKPPITKTPGSGLGSASRPSALRGPSARARMRTTIAIRMRHILYLCPPQAQAQVLLCHTSQRGDGANRRKRDGRSACRRVSPPFHLRCLPFPCSAHMFLQFLSISIKALHYAYSPSISHLILLHSYNHFQILDYYIFSY